MEHDAISEEDLTRTVCGDRSQRKKTSQTSKRGKRQVHTTLSIARIRK